LIANISGTHRDIDKQLMALSRAIHPRLNKKIGELWFANKKVTGTHVDLP